MRVARDVVALGRKLREDHKIRVRQPLPRLDVVHRDPAVRAAAEAFSALIAEEINVKSVVVSEDESAFATVVVKPNFKTLGKRAGPKLKRIGEELSRWGFQEVERLEAGETLLVDDVPLAREDVLLQRGAKGDAAVATDGHVTVALDTRIDDALRAEGIAREFVSLMQNARKDAGLDVSDRVQVTWSCSDPAIAEAIRLHSGAIAKEILAREISEGEATSQLELNQVPIQVTLRKQ
ncbi:MAG TPA: DUF5915 domain-containing protein, partial [Polyangiaceae bacterium]